MFKRETVKFSAVSPFSSFYGHWWAQSFAASDYGMQGQNWDCFQGESVSSTWSYRVLGGGNAGRPPYSHFGCGQGKGVGQLFSVGRLSTCWLQAWIGLLKFILSLMVFPSAGGLFLNKGGL